MIVPMKHVTVLCLLPDQEAALDALREMSVVHVTPVVTPDSEDLEKVQEGLLAAREAMGILESLGPVPGARGTLASPGERVVEIRALVQKRKELAARAESLDREAELQRPFGLVDPEQLCRLREKGVRVQVFQIPPRTDLPSVEGCMTHLLGEDKAGRYIAVIAREDVDFPGRAIPWPERSPAVVDAEQGEVRDRREKVESRLRELAGYAGDLSRHIDELEAKEAFLIARDGMGTWERIAYLAGYCPEESVPLLQESARAHGWGLLMRDPKADEDVPTLLRSPVWARPIKVIFDLIGILPGYRELDVSAIFLLFYSLFFAMLVSDAGYGMLFLALTGGVARLAKRVPREVPRLLGVLSVCTIVWGVLTGSYFGVQMESLPAPMRNVAIPWLRDDANLMQLCFVIGTVHLVLAHGWAMVRLGFRLAALAQLGWIGVTLTMYYLAMNMILDRPLPGFVLPMFLVAVASVALFMTPLKAMKEEWPNHMMLPLSVVGNFGDVVSYVRLFAVGSAGTAISVAFNDMAVGGGIHGVGDGLVAAIILFLAHGLNILLAGLGVIVHGVRLNTLEFSGHLGMQWTGVPFRPFRKEG